MNLKVPIRIVDELADEVIESTGVLDLASGEIGDVRYVDPDARRQRLPAERDDYEFTCGTLSNDGKDVEFRVEVDLFSGKYSVSANELLEIKVRAAKLFAGIEGRALLDGAATRPEAAKPSSPARKTAPRKRLH